MSCPICDNIYDEDSHKPYSIICKSENCGQSCCLECFDKLKKTCPFCRSEIISRRFIRDLIPNSATSLPSNEKDLETFKLNVLNELNKFEKDLYEANDFKLNEINAKVKQIENQIEEGKRVRIKLVEKDAQSLVGQLVIIYFIYFNDVPNISDY